MKAINSGLAPIKIITNGKPAELKKDEVIELDERTFDLLHKIFPALIACAKEEVIIEADAQPIVTTEPKAKKNATRKKSK